MSDEEALEDDSHMSDEEALEDDAVLGIKRTTRHCSKRRRNAIFFRKRCYFSPLAPSFRMVKDSVLLNPPVTV